jgi:hypothetical protein
VARPGRLELPTLCLEGRRSIQLSYGRIGYLDSKSFIVANNTILGLDRAAPFSLSFGAPMTSQFVIEDHALRLSWHHLARILVDLGR